MKIKIKPSVLNGTIEIPPSKSYSHRAVIAAALAENSRKSKIDNLKFSVDIITTTDIMENWGAKIKRFESALEIIGNDGKVVPKDKYVQCNESGSTIRFLIPIGITDENELIFDGKGKLVDRPLDSYYRIFDKQGIFYKNENGKLPLTVNGKLKAGNYEIDGNISSQFITGLLYALPLLDGDSKLTINKNLESKGYIDLTLEILKLAGIEIVEARTNYLAYAPEIAAVMLRRQQADAIIAAREKIVEGAVSMVKMALTKLADENVVELDDDKKASMVSNLMVVLCGDDTAQPVVNTGTLNM